MKNDNQQEKEIKEEKKKERKKERKKVSKYFEPSQPQRIISGVKNKLQSVS